jgi:hypothetical protein
MRLLRVALAFATCRTWPCGSKLCKQHAMSEARPGGGKMVEIRSISMTASGVREARRVAWYDELRRLDFSSHESRLQRGSLGFIRPEETFASSIAMMVRSPLRRWPKPRTERCLFST